MEMKMTCAFVCSMVAGLAVAYPKPYAADVSTPELKAALTKRLW